MASFSYEMSKLNPARKHCFRGVDAEQRKEVGVEGSEEALKAMCWMGHPHRAGRDAA